MVFAVLAYVVLLVVPLIEIVEEVPAGESQEATQLTLLADGQVLPLVISLLPVILTGGALLVIPKEGVPDRSGKINLWLSTFLIYVFVVISILSVGILFIPSAILITAAAVGSQVRRRTGSRDQAPGSKTGRGGGKRGRDRG